MVVTEKQTFFQEMYFYKLCNGSSSMANKYLLMA